MSILLWVLQGVCAAAFLAAGAGKAVTSRESLIRSGMGWATDVSAPLVKLIGLAEVLGAVGLILPEALNVAAKLTPVAAVCLAVIMVGAAVTHLRRHEPPQIITCLILLALLAFIAVGRFVVAPA